MDRFDTIRIQLAPESVIYQGSECKFRPSNKLKGSTYARNREKYSDILPQLTQGASRFNDRSCHYRQSSNLHGREFGSAPPYLYQSYIADVYCCIEIPVCAKAAHFAVIHPVREFQIMLHVPLRVLIIAYIFLYVPINISQFIHIANSVAFMLRDL